MINGPIIFEMEKERLTQEILKSLRERKIEKAKEFEKYLREYEKRMVKVLPLLC